MIPKWQRVDCIPLKLSGKEFEMLYKLCEHYKRGIYALTKELLMCAVVEHLKKLKKK